MTPSWWIFRDLGRRLRGSSESSERDGIRREPEGGAGQVVAVRSSGQRQPATPILARKRGTVRRPGDGRGSCLAGRVRLHHHYWKQTCLHDRSLEASGDNHLIELAERMERARCCNVEGIAFDEKLGLIRTGTAPS